MNEFFKNEMDLKFIKQLADKSIRHKNIKR